MLILYFAMFDYLQFILKALREVMIFYLKHITNCKLKSNTFKIQKIFLKNITICLLDEFDLHRIFFFFSNFFLSIISIASRLLMLINIFLFLINFLLVYKFA
jgi:hypothetical protein